MCKSPNMLADGTLVGCRNCLQCMSRAVDDWSGRCIAESKTATAPFFISLTYGRDENDNPDHIRASVLTYSDVQKYFKKLRKRRKVDGKWVSYPCRYFCVGEYGSTKGRAHWHLLVFWLGAVPPHEPSTRAKPIRFNEAHWDHGFSTWEPLGESGENTAAAVRYCCKYINKDIGKAERQGLLRMSKKPLLGADWLHQRAAQFVKQGLAPQDLFYSFHDVPGKDGRPKAFMLRPGSASADLFCQSFLAQWADAYECEPRYTRPLYRADGTVKRPPLICDFTGRGRPPPPSELIDEYCDRLSRPEMENDKWQEREKELEEIKRESARKRRWDQAYGAGFNLHPPHMQSPPVAPPLPGQRSAVPLSEQR